VRTKGGVEIRDLGSAGGGLQYAVNSLISDQAAASDRSAVITGGSREREELSKHTWIALFGASGEIDEGAATLSGVL
jgi:hypothetical protein